jgi:hypothetical protein
MKHYDPSQDKSSVRKYRVDDEMPTLHCLVCFEYSGYGYLFEIYDVVIDATAPDGTPTVYDNRLITSVFVCDECYASKTRPNE